MKKIFRDLRPVFESKEAQEKGEGNTTQRATETKGNAGKKLQRREQTFAQKKKKMIKCIVNYERDLRSFEAAWASQPSDADLVIERPSK